MRRKQNLESDEQADRDLLEHIRSLRLSTADEYREWCAANGFSRKLAKDWKQRCHERYHAQEALNQACLDRRKQEKRNPVELLTAICQGAVEEDAVNQPHLKRLCRAIRTNAGPKNEWQPNREALLQLLLHLHACRTKLFDISPVVLDFGAAAGNSFIEALVLISAYLSGWLRPLGNWKPRTHNARRQFGSLVRHLFAEYGDLPVFFDSVWFAGHSDAAVQRRKWYLYVGRGQNLRHCDLPIPYTKKMAHFFMHAPVDVTFDKALRWGQIFGLGGDERLARAILGTRIGDCFEHDEFWTTVIQWLIANPMLDRAQIGPIIDYLHHQRFVSEHAPGQPVAASPPQPNLTMKGRAPEILVRKVQEWHRKLAHDNTYQVQQWYPAGIEPLTFAEGSRESGNLKVWTIRELLSSKALFAEGRQMKHCVATYAASCARRQCSIWTMEVESTEGLSKALTIEIRNHQRLICQARGKTNRMPTEKERGILRRWATVAGLTMAGYV